MEKKAGIYTSKFYLASFDLTIFICSCKKKCDKISLTSVLVEKRC